MVGRLRIPAVLRELERRRTHRVKLPAGNDRTRLDFIVVTDVSSEGALLIVPAPIQLGTSIMLRLPLLEPIRGTIMWASNRLAGCRFNRPLHPALLRVLIASARANPDKWQRRAVGTPFN
jgi:hypothetical protein